MNVKQKRRFIAIILIVIALAAAMGFILYALKQNINLFYTPTELKTAQLTANQAIRIGGYVKQHSVAYNPNGSSVNFVITDRKNELRIHYQGVLPNLFREGQGVVVTGKLIGKETFEANEVLAKHDEKYMPPMVKKQLEKTARLS